MVFRPCGLSATVTERLTTYRVVFEGIVISPQYRVPYAVFGCLSIMAALISLAHHVHRARELRAQIKTRTNILPHPADAHLEDSEDNAGKAVVGKLEWELEKTSRDLKGLAVGMLCLFLEDIPMVCVRRLARADSQSASGSVSTFFGSAGGADFSPDL